MNSRSAIAAINQAGALLVFPLDNKKEPASLWSHFFPRSPMKWEWDESGDNRVADLWHLKTRLSTTRKVVYTKWFRGRATYFSQELFTALLRALNPVDPYAGLGGDASKILSILEGESPLSTKEIKRQSGLQGKDSERTYEKAMKELWTRCLIVAYGEVEDSSFPSLAVGATRVLFEDLWRGAWSLSPSEGKNRVAKILSPENLFFKYFVQSQSNLTTQPKQKKTKTIRSAIRFEEL